MSLNETCLPDLDLDNPSSGRYIEDLFAQHRGSLGLPSYKYSNDESQKVDLIVSGCSFTYGVGVEYSDTWGSRLGSVLGAQYVNISNPGWSMQDIVERIFEQIRKNGNPKYIAVLTPSLTRGREPVDGSNVKLKNNTNSKGRSVFTVNLYADGYDSSIKYSKRPHALEEVLSPDALIYRSITAINSLISYCKAADIRLVWGTWDIAASNLYKHIKSDPKLDHIDLGGYIDLPTYSEHSPNAISCFFEHHMGMQNPGSDNGGHAGSHYHAHWADAFYDKLINV